MSAVLATKITQRMIGRAGYIPIETTMEYGGFLSIMDDDFMYYTFKDCIKIDNADFYKWICYWENYPFAIMCDVKADKLITGYVKIAVLNKTIVSVSDIGEYPSKRSSCFGHIYDNKFTTTKGLNQKVLEKMQKIGIEPTSTKSIKYEKTDKIILSNAEIKNLKEEMQRNWGCVLK